MTYDEVVKQLQDAVDGALKRATTAEHWVGVHRWVFLPLAFISGLAVGGLWL